MTRANTDILAIVGCPSPFSLVGTFMGKGRFSSPTSSTNVLLSDILSSCEMICCGEAADSRVKNKRHKHFCRTCFHDCLFGGRNIMKTISHVGKKKSLVM